MPRLLAGCVSGYAAFGACATRPGDGREPPTSPRRARNYRRCALPKGSDYKGPKEALERYAAVVDGSAGDVELKGAKNPYTARNGHMFSFLDADGVMALRLPDDLREAFLARYESEPVMQYGAVMRGYVSVPAELLERIGELQEWFDKSYDWIGTLEPKPTKK